MYCAILGVNLVAFIFVYTQTHRASQDQAAATVEFFLQRGSDLMDARLEEVEDSGIRLANDSDIRTFMRLSSPLAHPDYYKLFRMGADFQRYNMRSTFADRVYLIFRDSKVVISTQYANPDIETFYPHFLRYDDLTYSEWIDAINLWSEGSALLPIARVSDVSSERRALTFRLPITTGISTPRAALLVLIPEKSVRLYFDEILRIGGRIRIIDRDGSILYDSGAPLDIGFLLPRVATPGAPNQRTWTTTGRIRQLRYDAVVPREFLTRSAAPVTRLYLAVLGGTIAVGVATAWVFAARQSRPISHIFGLFARDADASPHGNVEYRYSWLEAKIEDLIGQQFDVQRALSDQSAVLKIGFYERLLRGGFESEEAIEETLKGVGLSFAPPPLCVAIAYAERAHDGGELPIRDAVIHGFLLRRAPDTAHVHRDPGGTILILPIAEVRGVAAQLAELPRHADIGSGLAVGSPVSDLMGIQRSFRDAETVRRVTPRTARSFSIAVYESVNDNPKPAEFPHRTAEKLASSALSGDRVGVEALLDGLYSDNFSGHLASTTARQSLLADVTFEIVRIVQELPRSPDGFPSDFIRYLESYDSPEDAFVRARTVLAAVCRDVEAGKQSHNARRIAEILDYLRESHTDPMVCLPSVADRFGLNPQYFSRYFKEQTGQSFSAHIESLRMELATRLITESDRPLRHIAGEAGYLSWNSFYKAFRRRFGVSPGAYRAASAR